MVCHLQMLIQNSRETINLDLNIDSIAREREKRANEVGIDRVAESVARTF